MTEIGDTTLPGVQANISSDRSFSVSDGAPEDVGLVGGADLGDSTEQGSANANQVYEIQTPSEARSRFGTRENSPLTKNVHDALQMGASPVYAVAASSTVVTDDISGMSSTSGSLDNSSLNINFTGTVTIDGTAGDLYYTLDDPSTKSVSGSNAYVNKVTGTLEVGSAPSDSDDTNDTVEYEHYDYATAIDKLGNEEGGTIDIFGVVSEESGVVDGLKSEVERMKSNYNLALGIAGAGLNITTSDYSNPYDTSRMQLLYPVRTDSGQSLIGAYCGLRAILGISESTMRKRIQFVDTARRTLTESEKKDLDADNVVPVENRSPGVRFLSDPTCVSDSNADEQNMRDGLSRLIVDVITMVVHEISEDFIGKLHSKDNRNSMRAMISNRLGTLVQRNAVEAYTVTVQEKDAYTADVDVGVETVKPLRNVIANVTAGEVE